MNPDFRSKGSAGASSSPSQGPAGSSEPTTSAAAADAWGGGALGSAPAGFRSGFVALIGRPNVGKSTLLNQLVGSKVAITSPVAQTTRNRLRAILTTPAAQLVLLDTPGIHKPHHLLGQRLVQSARAAIGEVDLVLLLVDGSQPAGRGDAYIVELLRHSRIPVQVALNKCDSVAPEQAADLLASYRELLGAAAGSGPTGWSTTTAQTPGAGPAGAAAQQAAGSGPARPPSDGTNSSSSGEPAGAPPADPAGSGPARHPGDGTNSSNPGDTTGGAAVGRSCGAAGGSARGGGNPSSSQELPPAGAPAAAVAPSAQALGPGDLCPQQEELTVQPLGSGAVAPGPGRRSPEGVAGSVASPQAGPASWPLHRVSALTGAGCNELVQALSAALPLGPHLYPADAISDQPEQLLLAELIREQVLQHTREEVPHSVAVQIERIVEDGPRTAVLATVLVERASQKGILIGKGGSMLRTIGKGARLQMQKLIEGPVYLELFVKVVPGWRSHPGRLSELGYRGD